MAIQQLYQRLRNCMINVRNIPDYSTTSLWWIPVKRVRKVMLHKRRESFPTSVNHVLS